MSDWGPFVIGLCLGTLIALILRWEKQAERRRDALSAWEHENIVWTPAKLRHFRRIMRAEDEYRDLNGD